MSQRKQRSLYRPIKLALIAGSAITLGLSTGCDDSDEAQAAVTKARHSFNALSVGDSEAIPTSNSQNKYQEAEQLLSPYAGDDNGYAEAAALGVAMAKRGQASLASREAARTEAEALHKARVIRGMINEWLTMDAIAMAAGQFDPTADINEIREIIELRRDDIANYRGDMQRINSEVTSHESKIQDLREKASAERNQAGGLELQMPRVSAQEAADISVQVREHTLRADQFDFEADRIEGIVGQLRPIASEVDLNVKKADSQIALLQEAEAELNQQATESQKDAEEARTQANAAAQSIKQALSEYQAFRDNDVQSANSQAISLAQSAISATRDARDAVKDVAALNKADTQQLLAELTRRQADGYREEADLYRALSEANLDGNWDQLISDALEKAEDLDQQSNQNYTDAASSLRSARARGTAGERLEAAAVRLESLGGVEPEPEFNDEEDMEYDEDDSMEEDLSDPEEEFDEDEG